MRAVALSFAFAAGCASTSPKPAFDAVAHQVEARIGARVHWSQASDDDAAADKAVRDLLSRELTVQGAVQVALLHDPGLIATYEELAIAQADLVQAGLLRNPTLSGRAGFVVSGAGLTELGGDVVFDFLGLLMIPARRHVAEAALEATKARVADAILRVAHEVQVAYFGHVAATQILAMRTTILDAADASIALARKQRPADTISELDLTSREVVYEQARLDVARAEADVLTTREELVRRLGMWGPEVATLKVPTKLPELPAKEVEPEHLETLAIARRFDLVGATQEAQSIAFAVAMAKDFRFVGGATTGVGVTRTFEGPTLLGPSVSGIELPIFDQKQAVIARLEAQLRQSLARRDALAVAIRSEVRLSRARLVASRDVVDRYATKLVPLQRSVVRLSQQQYDAMLLGIYQLLKAKQDEVAGYRELIEALRDYWIARADLERAIGGTIPVVTVPVAPPAPAK